MLVLAVLLSGLGSLEAYQGKGKSAEKGKNAAKAASDNGDPRAYFDRHGYKRLNIPPGHYPPLGQCRIWYPGQPPGQQPPPGDCRALAARVPLGAWLIRHPGDARDHVFIDVYDDRRPGAVLVVGQFTIADGVFVRVVIDK